MTAAAKTTRPALRLVTKPSPQPEAGSREPALDDSELLAAVRAGEPSAAGALHDRVRPQVDKTIARLLGRNDSDADDVAQLSLLELIYTIDRFRGDCSLDSWVSTVTAHVIYKHIRRRQTERRIFAGVDPEDVMVASSRHAGKDATARGLVRRVLSHLQAVDEQKAWAFVLHDVCGYDLKEIATITGVSVAAAQARLVRGRREVHERIASDAELKGSIDDLGGST